MIKVKNLIAWVIVFLVLWFEWTYPDRGIWHEQGFRQWCKDLWRKGIHATS